MPSSPDSPNPVQELLAEAEGELHTLLRNACEAEARGVSTESVAEIRQLEDSLLSAAMAARQVRAARRHLRRSEQADVAGDPGVASKARTGRASVPEADRTHVQSDPGARTTRSPGGPGESNTDLPDRTVDLPDSTEVREFQDETGKSWRAWPVIPDLTRPKAASRRSLGDFQEGWICFEALDNSGRRRLPGRGRRWSDLPAEELPRLLGEAISVPGKKRGSGAPTA